MSSSSEFPRKPYTGSCHCGRVKYIVYLSLPTLPYPKTTESAFRKATGHRIYKCNCTICHKAGLFHIRPIDAHNDFFVTSPTDPTAEGSGMNHYMTRGSEGPWDFCSYCGVRPFSVRGEGYVDEIELPTALLQRLNSRTMMGTTGEITAKEGEMTRVTVWRPQRDWKENTDDGEGNGYCSVNGVTLDAHNDNLDLRQLHENGYVSYVETLQETGADHQATPYFGGMY